MANPIPHGDEITTDVGLIRATNPNRGKWIELHYTDDRGAIHVIGLHWRDANRLIGQITEAINNGIL